MVTVPPFLVRASHTPVDVAWARPTRSPTTTIYPAALLGDLRMDTRQTVGQAIDTIWQHLNE